MIYSPPVVINNIDEALALYNGSLPWEEDPIRARNVLAALEYILLNRPQQSQLAQLGMSFERVREELDRVRGYLGLADVEHKHYFQRVNTTGIV
jgi:hypothetical protein